MIRAERQLAARIASALAVIVLVVFGTAGGALAHSGDQSYLYVDVRSTSLKGRVELPIVDMNEALGLQLEGSDEEILAELGANQAKIETYLDDHLDLGSETEEWTLSFTAAELFWSDAEELDDNYVVVGFVADVGASVPREFEARFDVFIDEIPERSHLLLIENDWESGVIGNGWESLATFDNDNRSVAVELGQPSVLKNLTSSIKLGVNHIETGPDHILFVLVLLLPSVLVWREKKWWPVDGFLGAFWRILKIVTMFTIAHSITFTLAGLGLLPLPDDVKYIEAIIALSIAAGALHNLRPLAANREWLISFVFGLFHGLGFATLVSDLDISRGTQLISLLGRNIGIEIGQAVVVLVMFPLLFLLRRLVVYRPFFIAVSLFLTAVAVAWAVERAFVVDLGADRVVDPLFVYPQIFIAIAALTAVAAGAYWWAERNDALLRTGNPKVDADDDRPAEPVAVAVEA